VWSRKKNASPKDTKKVQTPEKSFGEGKERGFDGAQKKKNERRRRREDEQPNTSDLAATFFTSRVAEKT